MLYNKRMFIMVVYGYFKIYYNISMSSIINIFVIKHQENDQNNGIRDIFFYTHATKELDAKI